MKQQPWHRDLGTPLLVDILISATNSRAPTITEDMIQPGMHIAAIKSQEWSDATLAKGDLIVAISVNEYLAYSAGEGQYGRQIPASESKFIKDRELPLLEDIIAGKSWDELEATR